MTEYKSDTQDWEHERFKMHTTTAAFERTSWLVRLEWGSRLQIKKKQTYFGGDTWVTQSVKRLTLAQVMISCFVGSSPISGSPLSAKPTSDPLSSSLYPSPTDACTWSLSKINVKKKIFFLSRL